MIVSTRESEILRLIRRYGPLSRQELHQRMHLRPNTVGDLAAGLIRSGLLRERGGQSTGPGRPRQPLEIDAEQRRVVGIAFRAGSVSACELNLLGRRSGALHEQTTRSSDDLVCVAGTFLDTIGTDNVVALGVSATGFVDPAAHAILTSSATFRQSRTSLEPLYAAAGAIPILLENDMHALAANWLLAHDELSAEDILLIQIGDGAIGAALLVGGRPNRGCITGGNELGHARFPVETERCYCGRTGCLERICSTPFIRRLAGDNRLTLHERLEHFDPHDPPAATILDHLAVGIVNAVNFIRPNRVVLTGDLIRHMAFANHLTSAIRAAVLPPIADRVRIDIWDRPGLAAPEAAAWLALAEIYCGGWEYLIPNSNGVAPRNPGGTRYGRSSASGRTAG